MATATLTKPVYNELRWFGEVARAPRRRSMREFTEQEIVLPEGKYQGLKLRINRQPFVGLLLDCLDDPQWTRHAIVGCVQGGKTLTAFVIPILYHLFELRETTICGVPTMDISTDKWREELLPTIEHTRFRALLPTRGPGSRGGTGNLTAVKFQHGPTLKFMSGRGRDETRSGFTSRVVVISEVDKMDRAGQASREPDPITQLEDRMDSWHRDERRLYLECTVSIKEGRIWQEYNAGTQGRIIVPCPLCGAWVHPGREHLLGWQAAESDLEAEELAYFVCPDCGKAWTEDQRVTMNADAKLVHRGQEVTPDGEIVGPVPRTRTLGFRWDAFNNLFWSPGDIAADEWQATRAVDEDNAERKMRQFVWCLPAESFITDEVDLQPGDVMKRTLRFPQGIVPPDTTRLTMGVDLGKYVGYYVLIAWSDVPKGHVCDYGVFDVPSSSLGPERGILAALRTIRQVIEAGWGTHKGEPRVPDYVWYDAGYQATSVYQFCKAAGKRHMGVLGRGVSQTRRQYYSAPKRINSNVRMIGEEYHIARLAKYKQLVAEVNADYWKSWVHQRLSVPADGPGAITFFQTVAGPREHNTIEKHITNEKSQQIFIPERGLVTRWTNTSRKPNHYFDAMYYACAAGHYAGVRLIEPTAAGEKPTEQSWFAKRRVG